MPLTLATTDGRIVLVNPAQVLYWEEAVDPEQTVATFTGDKQLIFRERLGLIERLLAA